MEERIEEAIPQNPIIFSYPNTPEKSKVQVFGDLPPGMTALTVRILVVNALGKEVQSGDQIHYNPENGACVYGPAEDPELLVEFEAQNTKMGKTGQNERPEMQGLTIPLTEIDVIAGKIITRLKAFLPRNLSRT